MNFNKSRISVSNANVNSKIVWTAIVCLSIVSLANVVAFAQNAHYETLLTMSNLHYAESLRDAARYPSLLGARPHNAAAYIGKDVFFDSSKGCMRLFQRQGIQSLPIGAQINLRFPAITDKLVSIQWESLYDTAGFNGRKTYQAAWTPGGDSRLLEIQSLFVPMNVRTGPEYRILHSIRTYGGGIAGGNGSVEQLSTGPITTRNVQPALLAPIRQMTGVKHVGDGGSAYLVRPGIWTRYTLSWDLSVTPARLKFWISDEATDPTLLFADPNNKSLGFVYEPNSENHGLDSFWLEFNNSTTSAPADLSSWHRNFVVFKGSDVPLGGRPKSN